MTADLDEVLNELGRFGRYQLINYLLLFFLLFIYSSVALTFVFAAGEPEYRCLVPECENSTDPYSPPWLSNAVPFGSNGKPSECTRYVVNTGANWTSSTCPDDGFLKNVTQKCHDLIFRGEKVTMVNDFHLTCEENKWRLSLIGTMHSVGQFVGISIAGMLSDRFGRRTVMVGSMMGLTIVGMSKSFAPNYLTYISLEFMEPAVGAGVYPALFVLTMELVGPKYRAAGGVIINVIYAFANVYSPLIAWTLPYWRHMILALYTPSFIFITYLWLVPESVRWLMSRGRFVEAGNIIQKAAICNGVVLSESAMSQFKNPQEVVATGCNGKEESSDEEPKTLPTGLIKELVTSKILLVRLVVNWICWMAVTLVYYGLSLGSVTLSGNSYVNFAVTSLVEAPGNILILPLMEQLGRRVALAVSFIISGVACLAVPFLPNEGGLSWLTTLAFLLGKFFITGSYSILYTYSSEMFPTVLRSSLLSACSSFGRIGSMISPQAPLLAVYSASLPYIVYSVTALVAGFLSLILPETLNTTLPDTVKEAEELGRKKNASTSIPQI